MLQAMTNDSAPRTLALSGVVEEVRSLFPRSLALRASSELARLPNGRTLLIFRVSDSDPRGEVWVAGPNTKATFKSKEGTRRTVVLQIRPACAVPLLGVPASEFTDRIVRLEDVWGATARELRDELATTEDDSEVLHSVAEALLRRKGTRFEAGSARLARRAAMAFEEGAVRVESVAQSLGVTSRHLRRAFLENVGIGPKEFVRMTRLRRVVQLAETSRDWARIAQDAGYYDQAHFIGDFRTLIGSTPGVFFERATSGEAARRSSAGCAVVWMSSAREPRGKVPTLHPGPA